MAGFFDNIKLIQKTCAKCAAEYRTIREEEDLCSGCSYYRDNPELAPGYFTWSRFAGEWTAAANWNPNDPEPAQGETITVHRRDGTTSKHRVASHHEGRFDPSGNFIIRLSVEPAADNQPRPARSSGERQHKSA